MKTILHTLNQVLSKKFSEEKDILEKFPTVFVQSLTTSLSFFVKHVVLQVEIKFVRPFQCAEVFILSDFGSVIIRVSHHFSFAMVIHSFSWFKIQFIQYNR